MTEEQNISAETQRIAEQIFKDMEAFVSQPYKPVTPAEIKKMLLEKWASYIQESPLTYGIDYRIEQDGTMITIVPVSARCAAWFQGVLAPPLYEVTLNIQK